MRPWRSAKLRILKRHGKILLLALDLRFGFSSLRTSVAEAPDANCCLANRESLGLLPVNVIRFRPSDAGGLRMQRKRKSDEKQACKPGKHSPILLLEECEGGEIEIAHPRLHPWTKTSYSKRSAADPQPKSRRKKQLTGRVFFRKHKHAEKASTARA